MNCHSKSCRKPSGVRGSYSQGGLEFINLPSQLYSTRSIFRLPVPLMLGMVWSVVFVLISIELMQPEEPHPDSIEYQSRVDQGARSNPGLYSLRRGTLEDIELKEPAIQPAEDAIRSVSDSKERLKGL